MKYRPIAAAGLALGLVLCLGLILSQNAVAEIDAVAASSTIPDAISDAEVLEDWEFTRGRRGNRCRFTRPDFPFPGNGNGPPVLPPPFIPPTR